MAGGGSARLEHLLGVQGVASSNLVPPTILLRSRTFVLELRRDWNRSKGSTKHRVVCGLNAK